MYLSAPARPDVSLACAFRQALDSVQLKRAPAGADPTSSACAGVRVLPMPLQDDSVINQELLQQGRARARRSLAGREGVTRAAAAVAFLFAAAFLTFATPHSAPDLTLMIALIAGLAIVSRVGFEIGVGYTAPLQLVLVPMLLLLPPAVVPGAVALGLVIGRLCATGLPPA